MRGQKFPGDKEDDADHIVERGKSYAFAGYEAANFVGVPFDVYAELGLEVNFQTSGNYLRTEMVALKLKPIDAVVFTPADFMGRRALLEGKAVNRDGRRYVDGVGWRLLVEGEPLWPQWMEGKTAEALGVVRAGEGKSEFRVEKGVSRLVNLDDQLGHDVVLRGRAWSWNDHWWFEYRGHAVYVDNMERLPNWTPDNHARPIAIRGKLERAKRPDLSKVTLVPDPPLKDYFVVRDASWEPIEPLLAPERVKLRGP